MLKTRFIGIAMAVILIGLLFTGCSGKRIEGETVIMGETRLGSSYPIETDETLTYWTSNPVHRNYYNYREQPFFKELMNQTGVDINFSFAPAGQAREAFNLLIASNELPDIIMYDWLWLPGGPEKYINDGFIIELNEVIEKWAPNLTSYLANNSEADRSVKTDNGKYYAFPFLRGDEYLLTYSGPIIRKDLLDAKGVAVPETIGEWENALNYFKNELGIKAPLSINPNSEWAFSSAFGALKDFYIDGGVIKYGPIEPEWKEFLQLFSRWYREGLIDPDIATLSSSLISTKISSSNSASTVSTAGSLGNWSNAGISRNPDFELVGAPVPTLNKGETPKFGQRDNIYPGWGCAAITTTCKNVELAAKVLDFAYGEQGHMLYNFGVEGESYQMVDGYPKYTQAMYDYDGDLGSSISRYIWSIGVAPVIQDKRMYEQRMEIKQQRDAINVWAKTNMGMYKLPPITPMNTEVEETAEIMSEIETYMEEKLYDFLFGSESLDNFDSYVANIKNMGIDRVLKIKTDALERFNNR